MRIFLDLDDTLIYSVYRKHKKGYTSAKFAGDGLYSSILRPIAHEMISFAKSIDPDASILSTATMDWIQHWNKEFNLGFSDDQMYARDDFTANMITGPYTTGTVGWNKKTLGITDGVIIDNYSIHDRFNPSPHQKMCFMFGEDYDPNDWIQFRTFDGRIDTDSNTADKKQFEEIKEKIQKRLDKS